VAFYADFVTALGGMSVTGVTASATAPPRQVSTAQLPYLFPRLPVGNNSIETLASTPGIQSATCEVVVLLEAATQSTPALNFALALTMMDNLNTALTALAASGGVVDDWSIRQDVEVTSDGTEYYALVATVTGSG